MSPLFLECILKIEVIFTSEPLGCIVRFENRVIFKYYFELCLSLELLTRIGNKSVDETLILRLQYHVIRLIRENGENSCCVPKMLQFSYRHWLARNCFTRFHHQLIIKLQ